MLFRGMCVSKLFQNRGSERAIMTCTEVSVLFQQNVHWPVFFEILTLAAETELEVFTDKSCSAMT